MEKIIDYITSQSWDYPALIVVAAGIWMLVTLVIWHTEDSQFDLRHILVDAKTDRVSLHKLGQFVALIMSSLVFWYETMHDRLSEWLFTGYMVAWAGTALAKRWIDTKSKKEKDESGE